jgi:hypothetical protein
MRHRQGSLLLDKTSVALFKRHGVCHFSNKFFSHLTSVQKNQPAPTSVKQHYQEPLRAGDYSTQEYHAPGDPFLYPPASAPSPTRLALMLEAWEWSTCLLCDPPGSLVA